jgi:cytochrome c oxidase subunit 2
MWFTPTKTTKQVREETGDPEFVYEISCDQMCGRGHYSMRGTIVVETQEEYDAWMAQQEPQYVRANPKPEPAPAATGTDTSKTIAQTVPAKLAAAGGNH